MPHIPGKISVSRPLLQKSQSATFHTEISDFGTLALSSRSLKVLHFLGSSLLLGHKTFFRQRAERDGPQKQNPGKVPRKWSSSHLPVEIKTNSGEFSYWNWDDIFGEINSWAFVSWMTCFDPDCSFKDNVNWCFFPQISGQLDNRHRSRKPKVWVFLSLWDPRSGMTPKWGLHSGRTVLPKWPLWARLFYSVFTVFQSLWGHASARHVSPEPCFCQAHCFVQGPLRFLPVPRNPTCARSTFGAFRYQKVQFLKLSTGWHIWNVFRFPTFSMHLSLIMQAWLTMSFFNWQKLSERHWQRAGI